MTEFDCWDCGGRVICYDRSRVEPRCASCCWIRENVPSEHQAAVRLQLGVPLRERRGDHNQQDELT